MMLGSSSTSSTTNVTLTSITVFLIWPAKNWELAKGLYILIFFSRTNKNKTYYKQCAKSDHCDVLKNLGEEGKDSEQGPSLGMNCYKDLLFHQFEEKFNASWVTFNALCRKYDSSDFFSTILDKKSLKQATMAVSSYSFCKQVFEDL